MRGVVQVALVTEKDLLAALGNHAKGWVGQSVDRLRGRGGAVKVQPFQRLNLPIFPKGSCDTLDQLVSGGLRPVCLTLYLLERPRIHSGFFTLKVCRIVQ